MHPYDDGEESTMDFPPELKRQIAHFRDDLQMKSPVGAIMLYAGFELPMQDWEFCDGRALSRNEFASLFSNIGEYFGKGDGETTFNIPMLPPLVPGIRYIIRITGD